MAWIFIWAAAVFAAGFWLGRYQAAYGGEREKEDRNAEERRDGRNNDDVRRRQDGRNADDERGEDRCNTHEGRHRGRRAGEERRQRDRREQREGRNDDGASVIGSPVSGEVTAMLEGQCPTVVIEPQEDKLYAPAGGKVIRLFPLGNEFLFRTEFGEELHIRAGDGEDELLGRYYRPRVIQNEIVPKGKLLLEFDRCGLQQEGSSAQVSVKLEECAPGKEIRLTAGSLVRTGEEILRVQGGGETHRG